jgi:hypothetical protein
MRLPGFSAQHALYKTTGSYQMAEGFAQVDGITPQSKVTTECEPCYLKQGKWMQTCTTCITTLYDFECVTYTRFCPYSEK